MSLVTEDYTTRVDGVKLLRTYSDALYKIRQIETDTLFDEAIDEEGHSFTYSETAEYTDAKQIEIEKERIEALIKEAQNSEGE
jgi:hypothetical protein